MIAAASERPLLRRLGPLAAPSLRCCETSEIVADFPIRAEASLGALDMSPTVGGGSASEVERCAAQLSALIEAAQAISIFQRTSQFFDFARDLCDATTFFRFPCSEPWLR